MLPIEARTQAKNHLPVRFSSTYGKSLRKGDKQFPDWPPLGLKEKSSPTRKLLTRCRLSGRKDECFQQVGPGFFV
jgi:hypothetical protein